MVKVVVELVVVAPFAVGAGVGCGLRLGFLVIEVPLL
jgi:hypothetical protein